MSEVREWKVFVDVGTSVVVTVEAEDEEGAFEAAADEVPQLCAHCSGWGKSWGRDEWEPDWDNAKAEPC